MPVHVADASPCSNRRRRLYIYDLYTMEKIKDKLLALRKGSAPLVHSLFYPM